VVDISYGDDKVPNMVEPRSHVFFLLPSARISGGVLETFKLASNLKSSGISASILCLWKHTNEVHKLGVLDTDVAVSYLSTFRANKSVAACQMPVILWKFFRWIRREFRKSDSEKPFVFITHYSTAPFAFLVPRKRVLSFVQDLEWRFLKNRFAVCIVRAMLLQSYSRSTVVTTNSWVSRSVEEYGISPFCQVGIWADDSYRSKVLNTARTIDVLVIVRNNHFKRFDLYVECLRRLSLQFQIRCGVVTPDEELSSEFRIFCSDVFVVPSRDELQSIYQRSKIFLLLSDAEGFGLPPLEAMGSGCVPICRDSGGVRCYMTGKFAQNLLPLSADVDKICDHVRMLLGSDSLLRELSEEAVRVFERGSLDYRAQCKNSMAQLVAHFS